MASQARTMMSQHQNDFNSSMSGMPEPITPPDESKLNVGSDDKLKGQVDSVKKTIADYIENCDTKIMLGSLLALFFLLCLLIWGLKSNGKSTSETSKPSTDARGSTMSQRFRSI